MGVENKRRRPDHYRRCPLLAGQRLLAQVYAEEEW